MEKGTKKKWRERDNDERNEGKEMRRVNDQEEKEEGQEMKGERVTWF